RCELAAASEVRQQGEQDRNRRQREVLCSSHREEHEVAVPQLKREQGRTYQGQARRRRTQPEVRFLFLKLACALDRRLGQRGDEHGGEIGLIAIVRELPEKLDQDEVHRGGNEKQAVERRRQVPLSLDCARTECGHGNS